MRDIRLSITFTVVIVLLQCSVLLGQTIEGTIITGNRIAVADCTITVATKSNPTIIIDYTISNSEGKFILPLKKYEDSIIVAFSKLSFKSKKVQLDNTSQQLTISLEKSTEQLEEVLIETAPVVQKNDTLSYNVGSFRNKADEAIRDVIARLPGIDVTASGQIRYQGEPIENFYIEGINLLDGRYNIANNNLPATAISKVEILENHQSKRVLDSLQPSSRTSINLKLKNASIATTLVGTGAGLSPFMRDGKIVPLYLSKKNQFIGFYKTNSSGKDIKNEIEDATSAQGFVTSEQEAIYRPEQLTSIIPITTPSIATTNWFVNSTNTGALNYLKSLNKNLKVKTNLSYINETEQQQGTKKTTFFLPQNPVILEENIDNDYHISSFTGDITVDKNTQAIFFKNKTSFNTQQKTGNGTVYNDSLVQQRARLARNTLVNKFELTRPIHKGVLSFTSNVLYNNDDERLTLQEPVLFALNDESLALSKQYIQQQNLQLNNKTTVTKRLKNLNLETTLGYNYLSSKLESLLPSQANTSFSNELHFTNAQQFAGLGIRYYRSNWIIYSTNKLSYNTIDIGRDLTRKFTFEPQLLITKTLNKNYKINATASITNSFSNARELYDLPILLNFRTLSRYNTPIIQTRNTLGTITLNHKKILSGVFNRFSIHYSKKALDRTLSSLTSDTGIITTQAIDRPNVAQAITLNTALHKEFYKYDISLKITGSKNYATTTIILNNALSKMQNNNLSLALATTYSGIEKFVFNYDTRYTQQKTRIAQQALETFTSQNHHLDITYFPLEKTSIEASASYNTFKATQTRNNNLFVNLGASYTGTKNIKYSISFNNLFNEEAFVTATSSTFFVATNSYKLRPRNIFLSVSFRL